MSVWRNRSLSAALLAVMTLPVVASVHAQMTESPLAVPGTIQVHITAPAQAELLPPTLFGSFLEPIGHSTYGGLWADVVQNPSFENGLWSAGNVEAMLKADPNLRRASQLGLPLPWRPLYPEQGNRYAPVREDAANSYQSLLLMSMPGKETGIAQTVYLPVHRELNYRANTPYLDIVAAENKDRSKLLLFCVNRDLTRNLAAHLDLGSLGAAASQASVTTLTAENILAENDEQNPERIAPVTRQLPLKDALNYSFPNASVTVIEIPLRGRN